MDILDTIIAACFIALAIQLPILLTLTIKVLVERYAR